MEIVFYSWRGRLQKEAVNQSPGNDVPRLSLVGLRGITG